MNLADGAVFVLIAAFAVIGLVQGFIYSVFKIASFFISIYLAIKLHPVVTGILMKTTIFESIKASIQKNLLLRKDEIVPAAGASSEGFGLVDKIPLPSFLKDLIFSGRDLTEAVDLSDVTDRLSSELAAFIISVISLIALFIAIRFTLMLFRVLLQGIARLPVFKQLDKVGGLLLGALEGLLTIYILFAILMLFSSSPYFAAVFESIEASLLAAFFYENNFIVDMIY